MKLTTSQFITIDRIAHSAVAGVTKVVGTMRAGALTGPVIEVGAKLRAVVTPDGSVIKIA